MCAQPHYRPTSTRHTQFTGVRVEPSFLTPEEGQELASCGKYFISHVSDEQRDFYLSQMKHLPIPKQDLQSLVNMQRVTGRFESDEQKLAPWKVRCVSVYCM